MRPSWIRFTNKSRSILKTTTFPVLCPGPALTRQVPRASLPEQGVTLFGAASDSVSRPLHSYLSVRASSTNETVIGSAYPPVIDRHTLCAAASPAQWRESMRRVRERYPPFFAHTGSCARPKSSCGLRFSLMPQVFAGCCQSLLEDGPSRRYLCESFPTCLDPYPGCPYGAFTRFFP